METGPAVAGRRGRPSARSGPQGEGRDRSPGGSPAPRAASRVRHRLLRDRRPLRLGRQRGGVPRSAWCSASTSTPRNTDNRWWLVGLPHLGVPLLLGEHGHHGPHDRQVARRRPDRRAGRHAAAHRPRARRVLVLPISLASFGLGLVGIVIGKERRALHDVAAGTVVVYDWGDRPAEMPAPLTRWLNRQGTLELSAEGTHVKAPGSRGSHLGALTTHVNASRPGPAYRRPRPRRRTRPAAPARGPPSGRRSRPARTRAGRR